MNPVAPICTPSFHFMWRNGVLLQQATLTDADTGEMIETKWFEVKVGDREVRDPSFQTLKQREEKRNGKAPTDKRPGWDHVIEFDGGTSCNSPKNFGEGYGSYQIDGGEIVKVTFGKGHSNNSAEIRTLVAALEALAQSEHGQTVLCRGDSMIALKWINCQGKPSQKGSANFLEAVQQLRESVKKFPKVKGEWRRRTHSVKLFGH